MTGRPSPHQISIPKLTAFRASRGLRSAVMITSKRSQATLKHTDQYWKNKPKPILAGSPSYALSTQIASTGTPPVMLSP